MTDRQWGDVAADWVAALSSPCPSKPTYFSCNSSTVLAGSFQQSHAWQTHHPRYVCEQVIFFLTTDLVCILSLSQQASKPPSAEKWATLKRKASKLVKKSSFPGGAKSSCGCRQGQWSVGTHSPWSGRWEETKRSNASRFDLCHRSHPNALLQSLCPATKHEMKEKLKHSEAY